MIKVINFIVCLSMIILISGCSNIGDNKNSTFNLNDNIFVYEDTIGQNDNCGYSMFVLNLSSVFKNVSISKNRVIYFQDDDSKKSEDWLSERAINEELGNLKFDTAKEAIAKEILSIVTGKEEGLFNFYYKYDNHKFVYNYEYIRFKDLKYKTKAMDLNNKINVIFKDSIIFSRSCKEILGEYIILNEALCNKYNLTCDRW